MQKRKKNGKNSKKKFPKNSELLSKKLKKGNKLDFKDRKPY